MKRKKRKYLCLWVVGDQLRHCPNLRVDGSSDAAIVGARVSRALFVVDTSKAANKEAILAIPAREKGRSAVDRAMVVDDDNVTGLEVVGQLALWVYAWGVGGWG